MRHWDISYENLLNLLNLPTLANRRKIFKLCTTFKLIHNLTDFPVSPFSYSLDFNPYKLRYLHPYTLSGMNTNTNSFLFSFFPNMASLWNTPPPDVTQESFTIFKNFIKVTMNCYARMLRARRNIVGMRIFIFMGIVSQLLR